MLLQLTSGVTVTCSVLVVGTLNTCSEVNIHGGKLKQLAISLLISLDTKLTLRASTVAFTALRIVPACCCRPIYSSMLAAHNSIAVGLAMFRPALSANACLAPCTLQVVQRAFAVLHLTCS